MSDYTGKQLMNDMMYGAGNTTKDNTIKNVYMGEDRKDALSNPKFTSWATDQGIDFNSLTPEQLGSQISKFNASDSGMFGSFGDFLGEQDWGAKGFGGTLLGAGQLGLGIASYFDQQKTADKQRALMDQQLTQNKYVLDKSKADSASLAKAFAPRTGLAASTQTNL